MRSPFFVAVGIIAVAGALGMAPSGNGAGQQQQSASGQPAFDVASVKVNRSGTGLVQIGGPGIGRFAATNAPLRLLIRVAYHHVEEKPVD